jgi:hypothetical protein
MTGRPPRDLTARLFRALYCDLELRTVGSTYTVVPARTPWYAAASLSELARQISPVPPPVPGPDAGHQPPQPQAGTST